VYVVGMVLWLGGDCDGMGDLGVESGRWGWAVVGLVCVCMWFVECCGCVVVLVLRFGSCGCWCTDLLGCG
jgi:hypothetical protein